MQNPSPLKVALYQIKKKSGSASEVSADSSTEVVTDLAAVEHEDEHFFAADPFTLGPPALGQYYSVKQCTLQLVQLYPARELIYFVSVAGNQASLLINVANLGDPYRVFGYPITPGVVAGPTTLPMADSTSNSQPSWNPPVTFIGIMEGV